MRRLLGFVAPTLLALAALPAQTAELLMFEQAGCAWCARWNEQIGGIYGKTDEGRRAPLRRIDISEQPVEGLTLASRATFTPTFVLVEDGREIGRIEGYPGEDFFWPLLDRMLERLPSGEAAGG